MKEIESDYSIFHPSVTQVRILYDLANKFAELSDTNPVVIRNIFITIITDYQIENGIFHFEAESFIPQFKIKRTSDIYIRIIDTMSGLLTDPNENQINEIRGLLDQVFQYYIDQYAGRDVAFEVDKSLPLR